MLLTQRLRRVAQAALFGLLAGAAPANAAEPAQTPNRAETQSDVAAGFTIYVGGVLFVEGHFKAEVAGDAYRLNTYMETTGLAHRLYPAVYKLMSMGRIAGERILVTGERRRYTMRPHHPDLRRQTPLQSHLRPSGHQENRPA